MIMTTEQEIVVFKKAFLEYADELRQIGLKASEALDAIKGQELKSGHIELDWENARFRIHDLYLDIYPDGSKTYRIATPINDFDPIEDCYVIESFSYVEFVQDLLDLNLNEWEWDELKFKLEFWEYYEQKGEAE